MNDHPICRCGHCGEQHNSWWDDGNGQSGMACDVCDCDDVEFVEAS